MRHPTLVAGLLVLLSVPSVAAAEDEQRPAAPLLPASALVDPATRQLAIDTLSSDHVKAAVAIKALRAMGPKGLEAFALVFEKQLRPASLRFPLLVAPARGAVPAYEIDAERIRTAMDAIARQHEAWASHLYWYTDFALAKDAAAKSGKPILTLRMLGNLDEAVSCANSRFFRKTLYPNEAISAYLRKHFILHWKSVRPIPRITIDFGDGRKLEKTITGNSVHYVLDSKGRPLDALPGLYGPKAFQRWLERVRDLHAAWDGLHGHEQLDVLARYHRDAVHRIYAELYADLDALKLDCYLGPLPKDADAQTRQRHFDYMYRRLSDVNWEQIAARHAEDARLDTAARRHIERTHPPARAAAVVAVTKSRVESPMLRLFESLQRSTAEDTVRNEYRLHVSIHERFLAAVQTDVEALNEWVYAELFLTPSSDPWLGLKGDDVYDALPR